VIRIGGQVYGTAAEMAEQLGPDINAETVRNWRRRDGLKAYRVGVLVYSPLAQAATIEAAKRCSTRGRPRSLDPDAAQAS
jgi:hypothetical protein